MIDTEWEQVREALGEQRAFPQRATGHHAPGTPDQWERLYLRAAELHANARAGDDGIDWLASVALRALCCLAEERHFCDRVVKGVRADEEAITQALGKALGYPEAYPDVSSVDDGSVIVAPHVGTTIAAEAAERLGALTRERERLTDHLAEAERDRESAFAETRRWIKWHEQSRETKLAQPPARNVVVAFEGLDLGAIEEDIQRRVGMPAPPDYASRTIGQPIHVAMSQATVAIEEIVRTWHGVLVTFATAAWQGPSPETVATTVGEPEPGDPELAAAPKGSYRDRFDGHIVRPEDDEWVPF